MKSVFALALAAATLAGPAHAVEVFKWTDKQGVVHYGDRPASGASSDTIDVPDDRPAARDAYKAQRRLGIAHEYYRRSANVDQPEAQPVQRRNPGVISGCAEAWQRYNAAQACFNRNRVMNGRGVTDTGVAYCTQVPQPSCTQ